MATKLRVKPHPGHDIPKIDRLRHVCGSGIVTPSQGRGKTRLPSSEKRSKERTHNCYGGYTEHPQMFNPTGRGMVSSHATSIVTRVTLSSIGIGLVECSDSGDGQS
jgi:hypothetical protein